MDASILLTIKKLLGLSDDFDCYDLDVIIHINTAFATLTHLGVGPSSGFRITGDLETWEMFVADLTQLEMVKMYIYMKTRVLFDPPSSSFVLDAMNKSIAEYEWRLNSLADMEVGEASVK